MDIIVSSLGRDDGTTNTPVVTTGCTLPGPQVTPEKFHDPALT